MSQGIRTLHSRHTVDETLARLKTILQQKNIKLFAVIDHSGEAEAVGITMPPTKLVLFGNPKAGTPIMLSAPSAALDLPLKLLLAQEPDGSTEISWNDPVWLQQRHNFPDSLLQNIAAIKVIARALAEQPAEPARS